MKLLAITSPEGFLWVFPYTGDMGQARMLKLLELAPPDPALGRGARQVEANDQLRGRLYPLFPEDPWGQAQFPYWLNATRLRGGAQHVRSAVLARGDHCRRSRVSSFL